MAWVPTVDYSFSKPSAAGLARAGYVAAGPYVGPGTAPKHLTAAERDALHAAGLSIFLNVEGATGDARNGAKVGTYHGHLGVADSQALGAPARVALYAAIDFDVQPNEWPAVAAYLRAYGAVVRAAGYRVGAYGGLNAMTWAASTAGLVDCLFQTYAWSTRNGSVVWHPAAVIRQTHNGVSMAGGQVDIGQSLAPDFGQWPPVNQPTLGDDDMPIYVRDDSTGGCYHTPGGLDGLFHVATPDAWTAALAGARKGAADVQHFPTTAALRAAWGRVPDVDPLPAPPPVTIELSGEQVAALVAAVTSAARAGIDGAVLRTPTSAA